MRSGRTGSNSRDTQDAHPRPGCLRLRGPSRAVHDGLLDSRGESDLCRARDGKSFGPPVGGPRSCSDKELGDERAWRSAVHRCAPRSPGRTDAWSPPERRTSGRRSWATSCTSSCSRPSSGVKGLGRRNGGDWPAPGTGLDGRAKMLGCIGELASPHDPHRSQRHLRCRT